MICYRKATLDDLNRIWDYNTAMDPDEPRNERWRNSYISRNQNNVAATFVILDHDVPIGEVTLDYYAEAYGNQDTRKFLANGKDTAYVTALRIRKEYEGNGYVSKLMRFMESCALEMGFSRLTIGVGAAETRNLGIYLHWGYDEFVTGEYDGGELVLFYAKKL